MCIRDSYTIEVTAKDRAENTKTTNIVLNIDNSSLDTLSNKNQGGDQNFMTLIEIIVGIAIASMITVITLKKLRISKRN